MITLKYLHLHGKSEGKGFGFTYSTNACEALTPWQALQCPVLLGNTAEKERDKASTLVKFTIQ